MPVCVCVCVCVCVVCVCVCVCVCVPQVLVVQTHTLHLPHVCASVQMYYVYTVVRELQLYYVYTASTHYMCHVYVRQ